MVPDAPMESVRLSGHTELYDLARYYDIAFCRDVSRDVEFLLDLFAETHGRAPRSAVDLACGPGYHARALAARGLTAFGLDYSAEMIAYAAAQAAGDANPVGWVVGDIRDFALPQPVELALCAFDSIDVLLTEDDMVAHMRMAAQNLADGGLYVIEESHPQRTSFEQYGAWHYEGERDGTSVVVEWPTRIEPIAAMPRVMRVEVLARVREPGEAGWREYRTQGLEYCTDPTTMGEAARRSGAFEKIGHFGDFDLSVRGLEAPGASRSITVLRKTAAGGRHGRQ